MVSLLLVVVNKLIIQALPEAQTMWCTGFISHCLIWLCWWTINGLPSWNIFTNEMERSEIKISYQWKFISKNHDSSSRSYLKNMDARFVLFQRKRVSWSIRILVSFWCISGYFCFRARFHAMITNNTLLRISYGGDVYVSIRLSLVLACHMPLHR